MSADILDSQSAIHFHSFDFDFVITYSTSILSLHITNAMILNCDHSLTYYPAAWSNTLGQELRPL